MNKIVKLPKKQQEGSLNESSILENADVFTEGLKSLERVSMLFNYLESLGKEVKNIVEIAKSKQNSQINIKSTKQVTEPQKSIGFINEKFKEYEKDRPKMNEK